MSRLLEPVTSAGAIAASGPAFQDLIPGNHCWGCGPSTPHGLGIRSHWAGDDAICLWEPMPHHTAGPDGVLNGGIIAAVIDCHAVCTAIATAHRAEGRPLDSTPSIRYATVSLAIRYRRPSPITAPVLLRARVTDVSERRAIVACSLFSAGQERAQAEVVAARVPASWWSDGP